MAANTQSRMYMLRNKDRSPYKDNDGEPIYFKHKSAAKAFKNCISEDLVVSPGPDHRKW